MKKLISMLLIITLLLSASALTTSAYNLRKGYIYSGYFGYEIVDGKYARLDWVDEDAIENKTLTIPENIDGYEVRYIASIVSNLDTTPEIIILPDTVTYIANGAFRGDSEAIISRIETAYKSNIKKVVLPSNLTYIGDYAFEYCYNLEEITIPESVVYIGKYAFNDCDSLTKLYIPGSVQELGDYAFANCDNLKKVTFGEGFKGFSNYTFYSCDSLKTVNLPYNFRYFGEGTFLDCKKLKVLDLSEQVLTFDEYPYGVYTNKKGKIKAVPKFTVNCYETLYHDLSNSITYDAMNYGFKSVYFIDSDATEKLTCSKYTKTKLKIDGKKAVSWTSSNTKVAKITANGKFKAIAKGTTKLTATLKDGTTYTRKVKVTN